MSLRMIMNYLRVDAPEVTPITTSLSASVVRNFSVTISPSTVRWVMVLSAPMHSARLMWKDRIPAWCGISRRCAWSIVVCVRKNREKQTIAAEKADAWDWFQKLWKEPTKFLLLLGSCMLSFIPICYVPCWRNPIHRPPGWNRVPDHWHFPLAR